MRYRIKYFNEIEIYIISAFSPLIKYSFIISILTKIFDNIELRLKKPCWLPFKSSSTKFDLSFLINFSKHFTQDKF